jgi:hypothetical protein
MFKGGTILSAVAFSVLVSLECQYPGAEVETETGSAIPVW